MAVSLTWTTSVTNTSDTAATVKVTLKAKSTNGSYNNNSKSGWIKIDGTKYTFSHSFSKNTTTTLATKSKSVSRTTASRSVSISASYTTGVSSGTVTKSGSVTVSARPLYTVTFNANGGTGGKSVSVYSGYTTTFPTTSRTGYTFGSWSGYAQGATTPAITSSRTYTASWTAITYSISYSGNGGTLPSNPTTYNITSSAITLNKPTSANYTGHDFTGWTGTNGSTPQITVTIPTGSTGNRSYTANWRLNIYNVKLYTGRGNIDDLVEQYEVVNNPTGNPKDQEFFEISGSSYVETSDINIVSGKTYYNRYYSLQKNHGQTISLLQPGYPQGAKIFAGWETTDKVNIGLDACDLNGVNYNDNIKLKAVWSNAVRPVIFHYYRSATNVNDTYQVYKIKDTNIDLTKIIPNVSNYKFMGWLETDTPYMPGQTIKTELNNRDYDAVEQYTEFEQGDNPAELDLYVYDDNLESETFGCYIQTEDTSVVSGVTYYRLTYESGVEPIELFATWNKVYTVNYFPNTPAYDDGINVIINNNFESSRIVDNNVPFNLPYSSTTYTYKDSYNEIKSRASGWSTTPDGIQVYSDGQEITLSDKDEGFILNLYAVWTPEQFTLSFNKGIGDSQTNYTITRNYYTTVELPADKVDGVPIVFFENRYLTGWENIEAAYFARVLNPRIEDLENYYEYNEELQTYQITQDTTIIFNKVYYYLNTIFNLQEPFLITTDNTFVAQWAESYNVPRISVYAERYLDADLTTLSNAGKYIKITVDGENGFWQVGNEIIKRGSTYSISGSFYDDVGVKINEVVQNYDNENPENFIYELTEDTVIDQTKTYYTKSQEEPYVYTVVDVPDGSLINEYYELINAYEKIYQTKIFQDKYFKYYSGEITFKDTTVYTGSASDSNRTFTYRFTIPLKRGIGLHLADDLSAIALLDELQDNDEGLIVQGPISISRLWIWKLDPVTKNMYLEWIGEENE